MEEDVAGTTAAGTGHDYATCAECGKVYIRRRLRPQPTGLTDNSHSEFTELCPECDRLNRQGERPVIPDVEL